MSVLETLNNNYSLLKKECSVKNSEEYKIVLSLYHAIILALQDNDEVAFYLTLELNTQLQSWEGEKPYWLTHLLEPNNVNLSITCLVTKYLMSVKGLNK